MLHNKGNHHHEKPMPLQMSSPCSQQLEKAHGQKQRPSIAKNKNKLKN